MGCEQNGSARNIRLVRTLGLCLGFMLGLDLQLAHADAAFSSAPFGGWFQSSALGFRSTQKTPQKTQGCESTQQEAGWSQGAEAGGIASTGARIYPPPPPLPTEFQALAVLPLVALEVDEDLQHSIESALLREIDIHEGVQAISPADVLTDLEKVGLSARCGHDLPCLVRAGRYARAHKALHVTVAAIGGTLKVSMRLVDSVEGKMLNRVAESVSENESERAQELHRLAVRLLKPETYVGSLTVQVSEPGAEVYLDDRLVGTTPLPGPLENQKAGPHILRISKAGFSDMYRFVDVIYKRSSTISIDLNNNTISGVIVEQESRSGFGELYVLTEIEGVEIRVDGEPLATTLLEESITKVAAGEHKVGFHQEGRPSLQQTVVVEADRRTDLVLEIGENDAFEASRTMSAALEDPLPTVESLAALDALRETPAVVVATAGARSLSWRFVTGVATLGVGVASVVASGFIAKEIKSRDDRAKEIVRTVTPQNFAELEAELDKLNKDTPRLVTLQWATLAGGAAAAGIGVGLVLWDLFGRRSVPSEDSELELGAGAAPLQGGGMMLLEGRF